jgi:hypothetical protein
MITQSSGPTVCAASSVEIHRILGTLDAGKTARILALEPSLADLQDSAICMEGDRDVLAKSGHHVAGVVAAIIEILKADDGRLAGKPS